MHYHIRHPIESNSASSCEGVLQVFPATPRIIHAWMKRSAVIAFLMDRSLPASHRTHLHRYLYTQIFYKSFITVFTGKVNAFIEK